MKRILLTGGSGFIGRHLLPELARYYEVHAPSHRELDLLDAEAVLDCLTKGKYDTVIHSATQNASRNSSDPADVVLERTLRMFFNILRGEEHYGQLLYFGSGAEFDKSRSIVSVSEDEYGLRIPGDNYGFAKYIMTQTAARSRKTCNLRIFGCYGEYEDWEIRFISNAICKALYDMPITMRQNVVFDYMYVGDIAPVALHFIEHPPKQYQYNVCSGQKNDLLSITGLIAEAMGKKLDVRVGKSGLNNEYSGSNRRLLDEIPGLRFAPMRETIAKMLAWYADRLDTVDPKKLLTDK